MKLATQSDVDQAVAILERCLRNLKAKGHETVRRGRDWATPLRSAGTDPGRGKGIVGNPTQSAALNPDPMAEQLALFTSELGRALDAMTTVESRVLDVTTDAVVENQRAGIGPCGECNRYMDGTKNQRLRLGLCEACYKRANRADKACTHPKQRWSEGVIKCMTCDAELTEAGVVAQ